MMHCARLSDLPPPPPGKSGWPWTSESAVLPSRMPDGRSWPQISIVTPNYNYAHFLEATIRSILLQGYPNLQYVVIDGGSTDSSLDVVEKYRPWIAHFHSGRDNGLYDGLNKGFEKATGDIMAWLNSDDMYLPDALGVVGSIFSSLSEVDWLTTSCLVNWDAQDRILSVVRSPGYARSWFYRGWHLIASPRQAGYKQGIQQESTFWRRSLWERAGGHLDSTFPAAGDYELWARFWQYADLAMVDIPLGGFRRHESQKTAQFIKYCAEADPVLGAYKGETVQNPLLVRILTEVFKRTGRGGLRFGSDVVRVVRGQSLYDWSIRVTRVI
jgi:glycosyltransferase involved in cell wall biosynthesis